MSYTARKLITNSYYLSGMVARSGETVSGEQIEDGLDLLNGILAVKTVNEEHIPYYKEYVISTIIAGQEKYFIPNLVSAETVTYNIGTVRFTSQIVSRDNYFGSSRCDNISSLPFTCHIERCIGGANLYLYFQPSATVTNIKIWGKFSLANITSLDEDISLYLDPFYIEYLRYALAEYICADSNIVFQPQSRQKLDEIERQLLNISPPDFKMKKISCLQANDGAGYGINWAYINIGSKSGWMP